MAVAAASGHARHHATEADANRFRYVLYHADDNLILSQRLSEWISRAPDLEEDIAMANIALDLLGRARMLLAHAARLEGKGRTEDNLAMFRSERQFTNLLLVEQPNGDFAHTMVRQFLFDGYQLGLWEALTQSDDLVVAGIAGKAVKETRYHLRHSSQWLRRLGQGTAESRHRTQQALDNLWRFVPEMFEPDEVSGQQAELGIGVCPSSLQPDWNRRVGDTIADIGFALPQDPFARSGGRSGFHTEHLGFLLAEMQWMQRSYPGMEW